MYEQYTISTVISPISHKRKIESAGFSVYPIYVDGFAGRRILRDLRKETLHSMKEIELKAQYDSSKRPDLEQYLKEQGFQEVCSFNQQDEYFNHPERDFRTTDEALRLRREQHDDAVHCCLTYKGPNASGIGQSRRELETRVKDEQKMRQILQALGFHSVAEVKKRRKEYKKEDLTVCLDELDGLGSYVEIEVVLPESERMSAPSGPATGTDNRDSNTENRLREFLSELSFIRPANEPLTYLELVMGFRKGSVAKNASPSD